MRCVDEFSQHDEDTIHHFEGQNSYLHPWAGDYHDGGSWEGSREMRSAAQSGGRAGMCESSQTDTPALARSAIGPWVQQKGHTAWPRARVAASTAVMTPSMPRCITTKGLWGCPAGLLHMRAK